MSGYYCNIWESERECFENIYNYLCRTNKWFKNEVDTNKVAKFSLEPLKGNKYKLTNMFVGSHTTIDEPDKDGEDIHILWGRLLDELRGTVNKVIFNHAVLYKGVYEYFERSYTLKEFNDDAFEYRGVLGRIYEPVDASVYSTIPLWEIFEKAGASIFKELKSSKLNTKLHNSDKFKREFESFRSDVSEVVCDNLNTLKSMSNLFYRLEDTEEGNILKVSNKISPIKDDDLELFMLDFIFKLGVPVHSFTVYFKESMESSKLYAKPSKVRGEYDVVCR
jgi:hypothetical protein